MPVHTIQPTFAGGEFSPSLYSRVDLQKYATGLKKAKNFIVHPHGGASNRPGTHFVAKPKNWDKLNRKVRLVPFEYSIEQTYIIEFGHKYLRFYMNGGQIISTVPPTFVGGHSYNPGDKVKDYVDGNYYKCIQANAGVITPHADAASWSLIQIPQQWSSSKTYTPGQMVISNDGTGDCFYVAIDPKISNGGSGTNWGANLNKNPYGTHVDGNGTIPFGTYWVKSSIYEIPTPFTETDLPLLKFAQSADTLYIVHPNYAPMTLIRYDHDYWTLPPYPFEGGPFMLSNIDKTYTLTPSGATGAITLTASKATFNPLHVGALFKLKHSIPVAGDTSTTHVSQTFTGDGTSAAIKCQGTWRVITSGGWSGSVRIEKSMDGGSTWSTLRSFSAKYNSDIPNTGFNANVYGTASDDHSETETVAMIRAVVSDWAAPAGAAGVAGALTVDLSSDPFVQTGIVKITGYNSPTSVSATVLNALGAAAATSDWAEASWSNYRGFPGAVTFYQDRLIFAATKSEPQTIWPTKTGNYTDFGRSLPLIDSDSMSINLPSRKMNAIQNMISLGEIIALTAASEWKVGPGQNGVFSPTSVDTSCQGYRGSTMLDPVMIGNRAVFVQAMGSVVRDLGWDLNANGFAGDDLSLLASHLFEGRSILDMAYQQEPDSIVWCVRDDGKLLALTYLREQEVLAWTWCETQGEFEAVCSIPGDGYNEVWFVVKRGSERFIERLDKRMASTAHEDQFFVDCGLTYRGASTGTVGGLSHLNGKTVAILADGIPHEQQLVAGGEIALDPPASVVHVGLPYSADLQTLNIEVNQQDGTLQGRLVKVSQVTMRFQNSSGGMIGPDPEHLTKVVQSTSDLLDAPAALYSGDYKEVLDSSYEAGGTVFFRQADPLPVTILAIMPEITPGG